MIKDCRVTLNNEYVTVVDFEGIDIQLPAIGRKANKIKVEYKDGKYTVLPDNYTEAVQEVEEVEISETESKPKKNFEPKVKTSIVARPIFKSAYERYEWHMQNGCICQEDRTWLANYIKSDEYKEIYS